MEYIAASVVLKLVFVHGPLARGTLTGQEISEMFGFKLCVEVFARLPRDWLC